jgi:hypothetical protein
LLENSAHILNNSFKKFVINQVRKLIHEMNNSLKEEEMKRFFFLLISCFFLFFQGNLMASNLIEDIKQFRANNKSATVDVSALVKQRIHDGEQRDVVSAQLQQLGFELYWTSNPKSNIDTLLAVYTEKGISKHLGFHDEIRIVIEFENHLAKNISGKLIYRSL